MKRHTVKEKEKSEERKRWAVFYIEMIAAFKGEARQRERDSGHDFIANCLFGTPMR